MEARQTRPAHQILGRSVEPLREALLPYVLARVVVLGVLALAHFIVDRTHPANAGVAAVPPSTSPPTTPAAIARRI